MKVEIGQHLYAMNDIEVVVTDIRFEDGITYVYAKRLGDNFEYSFQLIGGYQYHSKPDSIFDEDTEYRMKRDDFFKTKPLKGQRTYAQKMEIRKKYEEMTGNKFPTY